MALGESLDNDTRGWIMTVLSGIGKLYIDLYFISAMLTRFQHAFSAQA